MLRHQIAFALAFLPISAIAEDCNEVLKYGVFDELTTYAHFSSETTTVRAACSSIDRHFSSNVYSEYGIVDTDYKEARKACEKLFNSQTITETEYSAVKLASKPILEAWSSCLASDKSFHLALRQTKEEKTYEITLRNLGPATTIALTPTNTENCTCPPNVIGATCMPSAKSAQSIRMEPGVTAFAQCTKKDIADWVEVTAAPSVGAPQHAELLESTGKLLRKSPNATTVTGACIGNRNPTALNVSLVLNGPIALPVNAVFYWQDLANPENSIDLGAQSIDLWKNCKTSDTSCTVDISVGGTLSANITGKTNGIEASALFLALARSRSDHLRVVTILSGKGGCGSGGGYGVDIPSLRVTTYRP